MPEITFRLSTALADRYRIERHLGEGGMATVYLAEDLKHKRKVAVKVLRPELAAVLGAERFVQEITTTANLQHPHGSAEGRGLIKPESTTFDNRPVDAAGTVSTTSWTVIGFGLQSNTSMTAYAVCAAVL